jgi:hypothetical protein
MTMSSAWMVLAATLAVGVAMPSRAHDDNDRHGHGHGHHHPHDLLACDDTMKDEFRPDSQTTVLLVKAFNKGDVLALSGTPATPARPLRPTMCAWSSCWSGRAIRPAGLPSTSAGIGIEVWLPAPANWNHRIHVIGGGGFAEACRRTPPCWQAPEEPAGRLHRR